MRYLILLICPMTFFACASDISVEDSQHAAFFSPPMQTEADTTPPVEPESTPTPYGMVIDDPDASVTTKGSPSRDAAAPALAAQKMLTGIWVNTSDNLEQVEFTPTHYKTYYEGNMLVEEDMTFHGRCPGACSGGSSTGDPCFTITGPGQTDCYGIVRLTDDFLELQLLGVSNETVVYRRAD